MKYKIFTALALAGSALAELLGGWKLRPENKAGIPAGMEKAVQEFQREQKLEPDGVIGRDTWPKVLDVPVEAILGTHGWGNPEKEKIECHEKN